MPVLFTSLIRKRTTLGPYRKPLPGVLSEEAGRFRMGEVPLQHEKAASPRWVPKGDGRQVHLFAQFVPGAVYND